MSLCDDMMDADLLLLIHEVPLGLVLCILIIHLLNGNDGSSYGLGGDRSDGLGSGLDGLGGGDHFLVALQASLVSAHALSGVLPRADTVLVLALAVRGLDLEILLDGLGSGLGFGSLDGLGGGDHFLVALQASLVP